MEIRFKGTYDKPTVQKAVAMAYKPTRKKFLIRLGLVVLFLVIYSLLFFNTARQEGLTQDEMIRSPRHLFILLVILYYLLQNNISSFIAARSLWKRPATRKEIAGIISNQKLAYMSGGKVTKEFAWDKFVKKNISQELLVLVTKEGALCFIPQAFFRTSVEWQNAVELVNEKVKV